MGHNVFVFLLAFLGKSLLNLGLGFDMIDADRIGARCSHGLAPMSARNFYYILISVPNDVDNQEKIS
jgi:hypothetical protein